MPQPPTIMTRIPSLPPSARDPGLDVMEEIREKCPKFREYMQNVAMTFGYPVNEITFVCNMGIPCQARIGQQVAHLKELMERGNARKEQKP